MTCVQLANQYANETGMTIPPTNQSVDVRAAWLLTQEFGCILPDGSISYDSKVCATTTVFVSPVLIEGLPKTQLKEDGFLAWVNSRGLQCINKLNGIFVDNQSIPSRTIAQPMTYCVAACYNVLPNQSTCFECIKQTLENPENKLQDACPDLYNGITITNVDTNLINESVTCHSCIANNSNNLTVGTQTTDATTGAVTYGSAYNPVAFETMWGCLTGSFPSQLSTGAIIGIVIGCLLGIILIIVASYYIYKNQQKKTVSTNNNK
jgi:hypothetical protein